MNNLHDIEKLTISSYFLFSIDALLFLSQRLFESHSGIQFLLIYWNYKYCLNLCFISEKNFFNVIFLVLTLKEFQWWILFLAINKNFFSSLFFRIRGWKVQAMITMMILKSSVDLRFVVKLKYSLRQFYLLLPYQNRFQKKLWLKFINWPSFQNNLFLNNYFNFEKIKTQYYQNQKYQYIKYIFHIYYHEILQIYFLNL